MLRLALDHMSCLLRLHYGDNAIVTLPREKIQPIKPDAVFPLNCDRVSAK